MSDTLSRARGDAQTTASFDPASFLLVPARARSHRTTQVSPQSGFVMSVVKPELVLSQSAYTATPFTWSALHSVRSLGDQRHFTSDQRGSQANWPVRGYAALLRAYRAGAASRA